MNSGCGMFIIIYSWGAIILVAANCIAKAC